MASWGTYYKRRAITMGFVIAAVLLIQLVKQLSGPSGIAVILVLLAAVIALGLFALWKRRARHVRDSAPPPTEWDTGETPPRHPTL
jgi:hypothetical protein